MIASIQITKVMATAMMKITPKVVIGMVVIVVAEMSIKIIATIASVRIQVNDVIFNLNLLYSFLGDKAK